METKDVVSSVFGFVTHISRASDGKVTVTVAGIPVTFSLSSSKKLQKFGLLNLPKRGTKFFLVYTDGEEGAILHEGIRNAPIWYVVTTQKQISLGEYEKP